MDKVSGSFVQVWQTSSTHMADDITGGVIEGMVRASGDLKITVDFPLVRETPHVPVVSQKDVQKKQHSIKELHKKEIKEKAFENSALQKIVVACDHFSEITTFHGMRLVCSRGPNHIRRFIWTVLVLGCLVALALQVRQQVMYFLSNPKTINVEKKFLDTVEFPTVTICNENAFRITAAYELNVYDVLINMFNSNLTLETVVNAGLENLPLDELNFRAGNPINHTIIRCRWKGTPCGPDNFTRIITDHGLCYSFNGPDSDSELLVKLPGSQNGLQLILNIEEYERMLGSHVASGIHILIHNKQEYPLVQQLGQAVAVGSHTFIALNLKKESRLGYPYDNCQDGTMIHVPNETYTYSMPACKTECYVTYLLERCHCRDYYMPGNAPVCNFRQYVMCLRPVQKEYDLLEDKICECSTPCSSDYVEASFSYGALSKLAFSKIKQAQINEILTRYKRALDVWEFIGSNNAEKKSIYKTFQETLSKVQAFYALNVSTLLSEFKQKLEELSTKSDQIYNIRLDLLWAQTYVVKKYFVEPKRTLDKITIGKVVNDVYLFSQQIINLAKMMDLSKDNATRSLLYNLLINELKVRSYLTNISSTSFKDLKSAYDSGVPVINDTLIMTFNWEEPDSIIPWSLVPKKLLHFAMNRTYDLNKIEASVVSDLEEIRDMFTRLTDVVTFAYQENITTLDRVVSILEQFKQVCENYFKTSQILYEESLEWPLTELDTERDELQTAKHVCDKLFTATNETLIMVTDLCSETSTMSLKFYSNFTSSIKSYLNDLKISKFDLAESILGRESEAARGRISATNYELVEQLSEMRVGLNGIAACFNENVLSISQNDVITTAYEERGRKLGLSLENITRLVSVDLAQLLGYLRSLKGIKWENDKFLKVLDSMTDDLKEFKNQAKIDLSFYSKNFMFLDIFFPDISYTVTEQQVAYDTVKLLSDIGGSMGLLVGASAISLFEFVDFFCLLAFALCWKRQPSGAGAKAYDDKASVD